MTEARISAHSHITGLGVRKGLEATENCGLVGMGEARSAASIFVDMVRSKKIAGKALLITGKSGTGKTALAVGIAKELGPRVPFVKISASEVFSAEVKKTEMLHEALRRATSVKIREIKKVYEGEVVDLEIQEKEDPLKNYMKAISQIVISLKSTRGSKRLKLTASLADGINKQKITVGDVVYIEADAGIIKRIGRSDSFASEYDLETETYVPLPKGEVFRKKEMIQEMTLHEIDLANAHPKGEDVVSIISQILRPGKTEITEKLRKEVNAKVNAYIETGAGEVTPGVLFVDEAHIMDVECFSFLNSAMESPMCPILVFATNRGRSVIAGCNEEGSFGMPRDFLDRLLIIRTGALEKEEMKLVIDRRVEQEGVALHEGVLEHLAELACRTSLRYALGILTPAGLHSSGSPITAPMVDEVAELFIDSKRSVSELEGGPHSK